MSPTKGPVRNAHMCACVLIVVSKPRTSSSFGDFNNWFALHRQFIDTVITPYVSYYYYKLYNTSRWSLPQPLLFYNIIFIQQPPPPLPPPSILSFVLSYNIIFMYLNILFVFSKYCYYYNTMLLYAIKNTKLKRILTFIFL